MFIFDEPTTGLHFEDVRILLEVFQTLVNQKHSVLVVEHNLDVLRSADWIIDLGPDAGVDGGKVVYAGSPEELAHHSISHTGRSLGKTLNNARK
jgi:excinuclease ABC subunit A